MSEDDEVPPTGDQGAPADVDATTLRGPRVGMHRGATSIPERAGIRFVDGVVSDQLRWIFRDQPILDYGIDAHAEVVDDDELVTGRLIALQVKSGESYFDEAYTEGWTFREDSKHLSYWLGHSLPTVVVIIGKAGAFWEHVNTTTVRETAEGFALRIPVNQPFDSSSKERLRELAGRARGLVDSLEAFYEVLPGDAVNSLRKAELRDRLAAARLADRLANGRVAPGLTVASVVAAKPTWLTQSEATEDLWMALAAYGSAHEQFAAAADAFELAAACDGSISARARAFAGLSLLFIDRDRAGPLLRQAADEGQELLADVGLSALDIPDDDARPLTIPRSMLEASDADLNAEPTVLNFLGEMALRRLEYDAAVDYRERAVTHSLRDCSGVQLALAHTIWLRTTSQGDWSPRERRRAISLAQAALDDRRRWDGPTVGALCELLDILITAGEMEEAVKAALPNAEGGNARELEASAPEIAKRGAIGALATGNHPALQFFIDNLPDGPDLHEIAALREDLDDVSPAQHLQTWLALLQEADDDALKAKCISRIVKLGSWPSAADDLLSRSIIPRKTYDTFKAVYRAESGELDIGLAALRDLARSDSNAARELICLLEKHEGPEAAITECESQMTRSRDPAIALLLVDLLRRNRGEARAAEVIERMVGDDSVAVETRRRLCRWYVSFKRKSGAFDDVIRLATAALDLGGDDADLAWNLVAALFNLGRIPEARAALRRFAPEPVTQQEVRLWMHLHLGQSLTVDDARKMIDLHRAQTDDNLRGAIAWIIIREVLITEHVGGSPFPPDVVDSARNLAGELEQRSGVRRIPDDEESVRAALQEEDLGPSEFQELLEQYRRGLVSLPDIADRAQRPYGAAILQRPAGITLAADGEPAIRRVNEKSAEVAATQGTCVIDVSSVYLLDLLDLDDQLRIRARLPRLLVAVSAVDDAVRTRDSMRSLAISTYTAALRPDGSIQRETLTATAKASLRERAERLERFTTSLESKRPADLREPGVDAINLALQEGVALWCDDVALRQRARAARVHTFGTGDLVSALVASGAALPESEIRRCLLRNYVVDLPYEPDEIVSVAGELAWENGPAHVALARRGWWLARVDSWREDWSIMARAARITSPEALTDITTAALAGSTSAVSQGLATQRYQDIVVLSLLACHDVELDSPDAFLDLLAKHAPESLVPKPMHVLSALTDRLRGIGVDAADLVAMQLLPGAYLPDGG